jgi:hypothetical protein
MKWSSLITSILGKLPQLIVDAEALNVSGPDKKVQVLGAVDKLVADAGDVTGAAGHPLVKSAIGVAVDALVEVQNLAASIAAEHPSTLPSAPPSAATLPSTPPAPGHVAPPINLPPQPTQSGDNGQNTPAQSPAGGHLAGGSDAGLGNPGGPVPEQHGS